MSAAPLVLTLPLAAVLLMLAIPAGIAGYLGWTGRLHRKGRLGLHTPAAQYSEEAFRLANRVAAPLLLGAAAVGALCAILAAALPVDVLGTIVIAVLGLAGVLGQLGAASHLGERAARTVPLPARKPEGSCCGGCGTGGCGGQAGTVGCGGQAGTAGCGGQAGTAGYRAGATHDRRGTAPDAIPDLVPDGSLH